MKNIHWGSLFIGVAVVLLAQYVLSRKKTAA